MKSQLILLSAILTIIRKVQLINKANKVEQKKLPKKPDVKF